jgi:GT2 family glycosyltransferase
MTAPTPRVSVIIPVYRDWDGLRITLDALARQTLPPSQFEIIVADNAPEVATQKPEGVRYCHQPHGYSYSARNAGAATARAPVLAFTDADCAPDPDWLATGLAHLEATGADLVGGHIAISPAPTNWAGKHFACFALRQQDIFREHRALATANLMARRSAFERIGGFDERFQSGGDWDFCRRAAEAGLRLEYCNEAVIRHPPCPSRRKLFMRNRRIAGGKVDLHFRYANPPRKPDLRFWWNALKPDLRGRLRMLVGRDPRVKGPFMERLILTALCIGIQYHGALSIAQALRQPVRNKQVH